MADKKKTIPKTTAPKRVKKPASQASGDGQEITTDDGVTTDDVVTTSDDTVEDKSVTTRDSHIVVEDQADFVAQRAYERYAARGYEHGHDVEDWLAAESDVEGA